MPLAEPRLGELLALIVKQSIQEHESVVLDGVGTFAPDEREGIQFIAESAPRVFIAYIEEECESALRLADDLVDAGLKPWIDKRKLVAGQNWHRAIDHAIEHSDFFVPCLSAHAIRKRGQFPHELRYALRCADRMPLDDVFVVPVRLSECDVPQQIQSQIQYIDLFPDWDAGVSRLVASIWQAFGLRLQRG